MTSYSQFLYCVKAGVKSMHSRFVIYYTDVHVTIVLANITKN